MKDDQTVRIFCGAFATVAYLGRLHIRGSEVVEFLGYEANSFVFLLAIHLTLALPETLDMLPVGPTRSKPGEKN